MIFDWLWLKISPIVEIQLLGYSKNPPIFVLDLDESKNQWCSKVATRIPKAVKIYERITIANIFIATINIPVLLLWDHQFIWKQYALKLDL